LQETTREFARRLETAVEGHPLAPRTPFGRQTWLREKLAKEADLKLSPNTLHKWFTGVSRPREDNIRKVAQVLSVDELWLSMGQRPGSSDAEPSEAAKLASGITLVVAGLAECKGWRVSYPKSHQEGPNLYIDYGKGPVPIIIASSRRNGKEITYVVPEPAGDALILAVSLGIAEESSHSATIDAIDLTRAQRQHFGGFSVIQAQVRSNGSIMVEGSNGDLGAIRDFDELTS